MKLFVQPLPLAVLASTAASAQGTDASLTQSGVRFVAVEPGVKLEVKDWGVQAGQSSF